MNGRARVGLRITAHALLNADQEVHLTLDAVIGDDRLLTGVQLLDLVVGPLLAVVIAARLTLLGEFALFVLLEGAEVGALLS